MLSDEDKKDVIDNKSNYTLDEIESKLSVICRRKKVNFDLEKTAENDNNVETEAEPPVTFNLNNSSSNIPAWVQACRDTQKKRNS